MDKVENAKRWLETQTDRSPSIEENIIEELLEEVQRLSEIIEVGTRDNPEIRNITGQG